MSAIDPKRTLTVFFVLGGTEFGSVRLAAFMECLCRSFHLDAGSLDHLGPLLGRFNNKRGELGPGADKRNVTQLKGPRGELRIGNASINLAMESFHDVDGGLAWGADALPSGRLIAWQELRDGRYVG